MSSDIPEYIFTKIQCTRHIIAGQRAAAVPCEDCGMAGVIRVTGSLLFRILIDKNL